MRNDSFTEEKYGIDQSFLHVSNTSPVHKDNNNVPMNLHNIENFATFSNRLLLAQKTQLNLK